jgi:hypothetical protein
VTTEQGTYSTPTPFVITDGRPVIESFSPTSGPPNTDLIIYGRNLRYTTSVLFNGQPAQSWAVTPMGDMALRSLSARIPPNATTGPITVVTPYGNVTTEADFVVTAPPAFTVTEWPLEVEAGMTLLVKVNDFAQIKDVLLNGASIHFIGFTRFDLIINFPTNATSGTLTIVTSAGLVNSPTPLIVQPLPVISGVLPKSGPAGTTVQLLGTNLQSVTEVWVGNTSVPVTRAEEETVSFTATGQGGLISVVTHAGARYSTQIRFVVSYGRITTTPGTISGSVPLWGRITTTPGTISGLVPLLGPPPTTGFRPTSVRQADSDAPASAGLSQTTAAPPLVITSRTSKNLTLAWPVVGDDYILEMNDELASAGWRPVVQTPIVRNGFNELLFAMHGGHCLFRLARSPTVE